VRESNKREKKEKRKKKEEGEATISSCINAKREINENN